MAFNNEALAGALITHQYSVDCESNQTIAGMNQLWSDVSHIHAFAISLCQVPPVEMYASTEVNKRQNPRSL